MASPPLVWKVTQKADREMRHGQFSFSQKLAPDASDPGNSLLCQMLGNHLSGNLPFA